MKIGETLIFDGYEADVSMIELKHHDNGVCQAEVTVLIEEGEIKAMESFVLSESGLSATTGDSEKDFNYLVPLSIFLMIKDDITKQIIEKKKQTQLSEIIKISSLVINFNQSKKDIHCLFYIAKSGLIVTFHNSLNHNTIKCFKSDFRDVSNDKLAKHFTPLSELYNVISAYMTAS